jgi:hypothetical protein
MYVGDVMLRDDFVRARELFEKRSRILSQLQKHTVLAYPLRRLGLLARLQGHLPLAVRLCVDKYPYYARLLRKLPAAVTAAKARDDVVHHIRRSLERC